MRLFFLGTPDFAVPTLRVLHAAGHDIALVVTRPDRPRGRHGAPEPPEVKLAALELGLPVFQPESANAPESVERLRAVGARLGVVVAYGEVLTADLLGAAQEGFLNLHGSLLPGYRGAAPINWAIIRGEKEAGLSVIRMTPRLDAGPILAERRVETDAMTAGELSDLLAALGAEVMAEVVGRLGAGERIEGRQQPARGGFFARKLTKEDGRIDWTMPARDLANRVRGLTPWPGVYCDFVRGGSRLRVVIVRAEAVATKGGGPGEVLSAGADGILVAAGQGGLLVLRLKPGGSHEMDAVDFVNGHHVTRGDRFE
jgi:methionyl-tRNA formyltransferase